MDLSTVNLQAEFRKFLFGYLEVVEIWEWTSQQLTSKLNFENSFLDIWKWLQHLQTEFRKSKLLYGDLGKDLSTVNLQAVQISKILFWIRGSGCSCSTCKMNFENRNCSMHMDIWERTSQQLTCKLNFENSFLDIPKWLCNNCKLNFENRNCCMEIWEWTSHYSTCKLNFENRNCSMEIWEWTSQQLTCKLNFENSFLDIWKWL